MITGHPGTWQQFQFRPDNKGLNIMEMKSKYLHEQYLFETQILTQMQEQQNWLGGASGGSSPSSEPEPPGPTYATEVQFYFTGNRSAVTTELGWDPALLKDWHTEAFGSSPSEPFDVIETTSNGADLLVTLKGNIENEAVLGLFVFKDKTLLARVWDVNDNCILQVRNECFYQCTGLTEVILNAVTIMGTEAFYGCTSLNAASFNSLIEIPDASTDDLLDGVFNSCPLSNLDFGSNFANLQSVGSYAFFNTGFPRVNSSTINTIGKRAFANSAVDTLTIDTAVDFGDRSFAQSQLQLITLPFDCTFLDSTVFGDVPSDGEAYVTIEDSSEQAITDLNTIFNWQIFTL